MTSAPTRAASRRRSGAWPVPASASPASASRTTSCTGPAQVRAFVDAASTARLGRDLYREIRSTKGQAGGPPRMGPARWPAPRGLAERLDGGTLQPHSLSDRRARLNVRAGGDQDSRRHGSSRQRTRGSHPSRTGTARGRGRGSSRHRLKLVLTEPPPRPDPRWTRLPPPPWCASLAAGSIARRSNDPHRFSTGALFITVGGHTTSVFVASDHHQEADRLVADVKRRIHAKA